MLISLKTRSSVKLLTANSVCLRHHPDSWGNDQRWVESAPYEVYRIRNALTDQVLTMVVAKVYTVNGPYPHGILIQLSTCHFVVGEFLPPDDYVFVIPNFDVQVLE